MSGTGGSLACAPIALPLTVAIGAAREAIGLDAIKEAHCLARFGVGREMLARIASGEVVPDAETEAGIRIGLPAAIAERGAEPSAFSEFFLARFHARSGPEWQIWFRDAGEQRRMSIGQARALLAEIGPLLAAYDLRFPE